MNDLERKILEIIEKRYKRRYTGGIKVTQLASGGYKLALNLGIPDKKMVQISADLNAEDFIKYIEQELVDRQLHSVQFFTGIKTEYEDDTRGTCCKNKQGN